MSDYRKRPLKCRAKNPDTCPYHSEKASSKQFDKLAIAQQAEIFKGIDLHMQLRAHRKAGTDPKLDPKVEQTRKDYLDAKKKLEEAEDQYNATTEGLVLLDEQIRTASPGLSLDILRIKRQRAQFLLDQHDGGQESREG